MDRSEQSKKNQAINLYTWGLELLSDGGHVRDADKVGWMLIENAATQGDRDAQNYLGDAYFTAIKMMKKPPFGTPKPPNRACQKPRPCWGCSISWDAASHEITPKPAITSNKPCRAANSTSKPPWPNIGWARCIKRHRCSERQRKRRKTDIPGRHKRLCTPWEISERRSPVASESDAALPQQTQTDNGASGKPQRVAGRPSLPFVQVTVLYLTC